MQDTFGGNPELAAQFKDTLSPPRFSTYMAMAADDDLQAIRLYNWNSLLSRSLYIYLQGWEVSLRNKLASFFAWKFGPNWPYDETKFIRNLTGNDKSRLGVVRERQERERGLKPATVPNITADLSAGFWVSMLSSHYSMHYGWQRNRVGKSMNSLRIYAFDPEIDVQDAYPICDRLLKLRNRVAHHEPILRMPLEQMHSDLRRLVKATCPATFAYCEASCTFATVFAENPGVQSPAST